MMKRIHYSCLFILVLLLVACSTPANKARVMETPSQASLKYTQRAYEINGQRYQPILTAEGFAEQGIASWYGKDFHGRKTSNGEIYDMHAMTAAHKTLLNSGAGQRSRPIRQEPNS
jgi:rare lipoprotein A